MSAPARVVAVMAHPDDPELWAGATLAASVRAGATVTIILPRRGEPRDAEATTSAGILGAALTLVDDLTPAVLDPLLRDLRPEVLITHPATDMHPEHRRVADTVNAALPDVVIATGHPRRVYACDSYHNLDRDGRPLHLPVILDATTTWDTKMRALSAHTSQPITEHFAPMALNLGHLHGGRIGTAVAEAFAAVPVLGRLAPRAWL
ncbi:PIG-L deacetylase family protein [Actinoplanes sp. NPDC051859]|uniref:PIG-L deacetylase family protein n=1 Tax=Actinoplanes sp. NPDC051859 TaxID=3363909 RepID=UPI0037A6894A